MTAPAAGGGDTRDGREWSKPCFPCAKEMHCYGSGISGSQGCVCRVCGPRVPARPAAAPADDTGELREAMARWLLEFDSGRWDRADEEYYRQQADAVLALPAVRDLTDGRRTDRARIAAVEALAAKAANFGTLHVWSGFEIAEHLRRALGGATQDGEQRGRCGNQAPPIAGIASTAVWCKLPAGHAGWHKGDDGSEWMFRPYGGAS